MNTDPKTTGRMVSNWRGIEKDPFQVAMLRIMFDDEDPESVFG